MTEDAGMTEGFVNDSCAGKSLDSTIRGPSLDSRFRGNDGGGVTTFAAAVAGRLRFLAPLGMTESVEMTEGVEMTEDAGMTEGRGNDGTGAEMRGPLLVGWPFKMPFPPS